MIDSNRGLQPLQEAEPAIAKLQDYESTAELASALTATAAAVQRSLRYLLRADKTAPDDLRLSALSPSDLAPENLIPALRQRDLISLDLAHNIHELNQAAQRAERGGTRAADGDLAMRVVDQLRTEIKALGDRNVREIAHHAVEAGALNQVHEVPPEKASRLPRRLLPAVALGLVVVVALWLMLRDSPTERGVKHFERGEHEQAEQTLREVTEDDPGDATAAYYLATLYRRSQRYEEAGRVLRRAIEKNPVDPYLREEMGNLFMALNRPELAVRQYKIAQEQRPEEPRYWIKLVGAMRNAGDPEAEAVLQRAPEEARAMLQSGR
ncbi:MAG: tetratricopeptide repeat protein [Gemmatimonadota bacterium]